MSGVLDRYPLPWRWRDSYDFGEHLEHRDRIFEVECSNRRDGRIELVAANDEVVISQWADYAGDAGLSVDEDVAKWMVAVINGAPREAGG